MALRGIAFARKAVAYGVGAILSTVDWVVDRLLPCCHSRCRSSDNVTAAIATS
jgi:hypothetical protein